MLEAMEKRSDRRIPYKHVIRYSYPSLNSENHQKAYGYVKKICSTSSLCDAIVSRFVSSNLLKGVVSPKRTWATTEDVSAGGISLVVSQRFDVGQDMLVFDERLSDNPLLARVRWCREASDRMYKVGLKYNSLGLRASNGWFREKAGATVSA